MPPSSTKNIKYLMHHICCDRCPFRRFSNAQHTGYLFFDVPDFTFAVTCAFVQVQRTRDSLITKKRVADPWSATLFLIQISLSNSNLYFIKSPDFFNVLFYSTV